MSRTPGTESLQSRLFKVALRVVRRKGHLKRLADRLEAGHAKGESRRKNEGFLVSDEPPPKMRERYGLEQREVRGRNVFILSPKTRPSEHHVLYLHGGAYISNFAVPHWRFMGRLVDGLGCSITAPDYPLAPESTYKDAFAMVLPIYSDLVRRVGPANVTLMGDSSGGGMSLALAQRLREEGLPQPANLVLISPWLDVTLGNAMVQEADKKDPFIGVAGARKAGRMYAGGDDPNSYLLSPINGSLEGLGKITVFIGTHDVLLPDCRRLKARAEARGILLDYREYEDMVHVWPLFTLPESNRALAQIVAAVGEHDGGARTCRYDRVPARLGHHKNS